MDKDDLLTWMKFVLFYEVAGVFASSLILVANYFDNGTWEWIIFAGVAGMVLFVSTAVLLLKILFDKLM